MNGRRRLVAGIVLVNGGAIPVAGAQSAERVGSSWVRTHARVRNGKTVPVLDGRQRALPRADLRQLK